MRGAGRDSPLTSPRAPHRHGAAPPAVVGNQQRHDADAHKKDGFQQLHWEPSFFELNTENTENTSFLKKPKHKKKSVREVLENHVFSVFSVFFRRPALVALRSGEADAIPIVSGAFRSKMAVFGAIWRGAMSAQRARSGRVMILLLGLV